MNAPISEAAELLRSPKLLERTFAALVPISFFIGDYSKHRCPFHDDNNPSAKLYSNDADGIERLWCFTCHKQYTSWDYIREYHPEIHPFTALLEDQELGGEAAIVAEANRQRTTEVQPANWSLHYEGIHSESANLLDYVHRCFQPAEEDAHSHRTGLEAFMRMYDRTTPMDSMNADKLGSDPNFLLLRRKHGLPARAVSQKMHLKHLVNNEKYYDFFNSARMFWLVPCDLPDGEVVGFAMRAITIKEHSQFSPPTTMPLLFGFATFAEFVQGHPIVLVEGVKDCIRLQQHYPYVLAGLTAGLSDRSLCFLRKLTNRFILALDSDATGKRATARLKKAMQGYGADVEVVKPPPPAKDWAELDHVTEEYIHRRLEEALMVFGVQIGQHETLNHQEQVH